MTAGTNSMKPRVYHRISALIRQARKEAEQCDAVSFDVFDTLVVRRLHDPDLLKMAVARYISRRAQEAGVKIAPEKVQRLRDKVEAMHRRRSALNHPDREARYPLFMADTLKIIFGTDSNDELLKDVTDYELSIESSFLVARAEMLALIDELRSAGKKIAAISDVYLPARCVAELLDRAGFAGRFDLVYSSADSYEAKASGAAWPRVRDLMKIEPGRWLHIGDNPISDGARPAEFGIRALVLLDASERHRRAISRNYHELAHARPFWRGRLAQQWMLPLSGENREVPALFSIGRQYFGPLLCAFIQHVAEQCLKNGVRRVYFLSREGQILRNIWKKITPVIFAGNGSVPSDHYLYVSRMALAGVACGHQGLSVENANIAFLPATNRDFRDLCRVYNLDVARLRGYLGKYGLREDTPLSRWHDGWTRSNVERLRRLLETCEPFQDEVRRQSRPGNDALQQYLESEHFFDEGPVALVDIGWLGTIQRFLHEAIRHRPDRPVLNGFTLACTGGYPFPYADDNKLEGFYFDHKKWNFAGSIVLYAQEVFEEATRAHHCGLTGYRPHPEKGFELEFRAEDDPCSVNEREQSEYFAPLQDGILAAADRYGPVMAVLGYKAEEWRPWLNVQTVNQIAFPRTSEVALLTRIHHVDDFASNRPRPARARKALTRLWNRPLWQLRAFPWLRPYYFLKHAVFWLRT